MKHCPKCFEKDETVYMERKGTIYNEDDDEYNTTIYQCPKCKNIEIYHD